MSNKNMNFIYTKKDEYSENQIGYLMREEYISVKLGCSVSESMSRLIKEAGHTEHIKNIYVTDASGLYIGYIPLHKLIIARKETPLESIIKKDLPKLYDTDETDKIISIARNNFTDSIPILDKSSKRMIGILTLSDIASSAEDIFEEDYARFASLTDEEIANGSIKDSIKKRIPWLCVLFVLSVFVSTVVGLFENVIKELSAVICFQSLILGMAGNTGTQSLAVTIREITGKGNIPTRQMLLKEAKIGALNGLLIGALSFFIMTFYFFILKKFDASFSIISSVVISLSLCVSMLLSAIIGVVVPLTFKKFGIDPAVASGPLITTFNDLCSVFVFYGLCFIWLLNIFVY